MFKRIGVSDKNLIYECKALSLCVVIPAADPISYVNALGIGTEEAEQRLIARVVIEKHKDEITDLLFTANYYEAYNYQAYVNINNERGEPTVRVTVESDSHEDLKDIVCSDDFYVLLGVDMNECFEEADDDSVQS
jgi:hypothetical protein